jgi:hypothetical protein
MKQKRDRGWRRDQTQKIVEKRLNTVKIWCSGTHYDGFHDHFERSREYNTPGYLRKWNFTCDCGCCKYDRYLGKVERERAEEKERRLFEEEYGSIIYY